jgi:hypothetical protein
LPAQGRSSPKSKENIVKKLITSLCASMLAGAMAVTSLTPAVAMPNLVAPVAQKSSDVKLAQFVSEEELRRLRRNDRRFERQRDRRFDRRQERREDRREAFERRNDGGYYYRGYRGYRDARPGYRYHNGYYFPSAAFIAGALVTGAIVNSQPRVVVRQGGNAHVDWCYNRYRSYRASDDTYQPLSGPRQRCVSPY